MATSGKTAKAVLALTALFALAALGLQLYLSLDLAAANGQSIGHGLVAYLGYFTITTNLLVFVASAAPSVMPAIGIGRFFLRPVAVGWVASSIAFVGLAYYFLLRHVWAPQGLRLVANVLLHYVVPTLYVVFSFIALRGVRLRWTAPLWWSLYLVVYFLYALIRGAVLGMYPYGFIDVSTLGYAIVWRNGLLLWVAFLVLAHLLMLLWRISAPALNRSDRTPL